MKFFAKVYKLVDEIPYGKVTTYGEIAQVLGTRDARKVGWALHANADRDRPCHRVVSKEGRIADNFAFDGWQEQKLRLESEGIEFRDEMHVDLNFYFWQLSPLID